MDTRDAILEAFQALVARSSYGAVSVEQICQEASVSRRTFYRYFEDKLSALKAVLEADLIKPVHDIHDLIDSDSLKSSPTIIYGRALRKVYEKRDFYGKVFTRSEPALLSLYMDMVVRINKDSQGMAEVPEREAEFASYVIAAASTYALAKWLDEGCRVPVEEQTRMCLRWIYGRFRELDNEAGRWRTGRDPVDPPA